MELLNQLKRLWRALRGTPNSWPAIDLSLPGGRHLHLVGSIHMGTRDMAPLPAKLVKKLRQADALLALPPGRYVVAVGALHLYGEGNLPQILK